MGKQAAAPAPVIYETGAGEYYTARGKSQAALAQSVSEPVKSAIDAYMNIRVKELDNRIRAMEAVIQQNVATINARAQMGTKYIDEADEILTPVSRPFHRHGTNNPKTGAYQSEEISLLEVMFGLWIFSDYMARNAEAEAWDYASSSGSGPFQPQLDWTKVPTPLRKQYFIYHNIAYDMERQFKALTRTNMQINGAVADIEAPVQSNKSGGTRDNRVANVLGAVAFPGLGLDFNSITQSSNGEDESSDEQPW